MKKLLRLFHYGEKGFTLVELLVAVAILGILAAVALPSLTGLTGNAKTKAAEAEKITVQTAVDAMMAANTLNIVTATAATSDMSAFPTGNPIYPTYMRTQITKGTYSCIADGTVTQASTGY